MLHLLLATFLLGFLLTQAEVINDPTLKPTPNFSACGDADALLNFDSKQLANLWYHRIYDERKKIEECFNKKHSAESAVTLVGALQLHSGYGLDSLYTMSLQSPENMLADTIQVGIDTGKGLEGDIEEAVCANDKQMKDRIDKYYQEKFKKTVESHLATFRADDPDYQNVMKKHCWKGLCQEKKITPEDADKEAQALRAISPKDRKVDFKNKLIELLDKFCEPDLKLIFQKYRQGDNGIDNAVSDAFECERVRRAYSTLVRYIEDTCKYYASELRHAADDSRDLHIYKINRIILTRSE